MKPSNIMLNTHGHIMLVDFGIAKTFQTGQKGTMIGTEGYSPPEQYKGEATPLADIYSLGATLHHLLTQRDPRLEPPFSFGERMIRSINPAVSVEMETVIYTALQYNPNRTLPIRQEDARSAPDQRQEDRDTFRAAHCICNVHKPILPEQQKPCGNLNVKMKSAAVPLYHDGILYIGSYDNNLYALQAATGEFVWKYATDGGVVSRPAFYEGNIYFGSEDKRLHCISARSGKVVWTYQTNGPIRSSPVVSDGHIFIGSDDAFLHVVNALSGRRAWRVDAGAPVRSTPCIHIDNVYFGNEVGDLFCVNLGGNTRWRFKAKRAITSSPVYSDGVVFAGSVDTMLYALDAKTGYILWRFRMSRATISTPCIFENYHLYRFSRQ